MKAAENNRIKIICFTDRGEVLLRKLTETYTEDGEYEIYTPESVDSFTKKNFNTGNILLFIGACGIAVRAIAPYIRDKETDPGVLVTDENGDHVIPILSGHIGGAVKAAEEIADIIGGVPVHTTATDCEGTFAVDSFAAENSLIISDMKKAKAYTVGVLKGEENRFRISYRVDHGGGLTLIPRCIVLGIGCRKGMDHESLYRAVQEVFEENGIDIRAVKAMVSIDMKAEEKGLISLKEELKVPFITYTADELMAVEGEFDPSEFVYSKTGTDNVCERAVMAYGCDEILIKKTKKDGITISAGIIKRDDGYEIVFGGDRPGKI